MTTNQRVAVLSRDDAGSLVYSCRWKRQEVALKALATGAHQVIDTTAPPAERLRALQPLLPEGWVLAPRPPTPEMVAAGRSAIPAESRRYEQSADFDQEACDVYDAMLAEVTLPASPAAKEVQGG